MKALRNWQFETRTATGVVLRVDGRHMLQIDVLDHAVIRVSVQKDGRLRNPRTWSIALNGDAPWEGRDRMSTDGFPCPAFHWDGAGSLETDHLRVQVNTPLSLDWSYRTAPHADWQPLAQDRPEDAYMLGAHDHRHAHFLRRFVGDRVYGLGEKSGALERSGRRFEMRNLDAMGYDAGRTDPLYKHWPFSLTRRAHGVAYGVFYDNLATCWFDIGNELDNYHPPFRSYRAEDGDLQYTVIAGADLLSVLKPFHRMIGGMAFMPLWGLGYSGSSMALADAPDGQRQIEGFLDRCRAEDIPIDSFQMSSGYTSIGHRRYVFNWNHDRFPDVVGLTSKFAGEDVRLVANVKPVLLDDHPKYAEASGAGLFIRSEDGTPETGPFWDGRGAHLDMTNPDTIRWWQANLRNALLDQGITASWNDNNEYEVWDSTAQCQGFGTATDISLIRPLHGQLMTRASYDAQRDHTPHERPYVISRSGAPGTQRYAQSWSGDNRTNWDTLRDNIAMGLGQSLSGFYNTGHDVGGFAGPPPGPELFLRWVQNGIFHPRFTIHSWNDDHCSNTPWMHPEVTAHVRDAIHLRYRLMPYLYTQLYRAVTQDEPMLRPLFLDHPNDAQSYAPKHDFLFGPSLLVATVVEPGAPNRSVYLPPDPAGWWDFHTGKWRDGGQTITIPTGPETVPLFVRGGTVLPLACGPFRGTRDTLQRRELAVFPPGANGTWNSWLYEDDGLASDALDGNHAIMTFHLTRSAEETNLTWERSGAFHPFYDQATIRLPQGFRGTLNADNTRILNGASLPDFPKGTP